MKVVSEWFLLWLRRIYWLRYSTHWAGKGENEGFLTILPRYSQRSLLGHTDSLFTKPGIKLTPAPYW